MSRRSIARIALLFGVTLAVVHTRAHADSRYDSFRYPDVHSRSLFVASGLSQNSSRTDQATASQRTFNSQGELRLRGSWFDQTERHSRALALSVTPSWGRALIRETRDFGTIINSSGSDRDATLLRSNLSWSESAFTRDSRWGVTSSLAVVHLYSRDGTETRNSTLTGPDEQISRGSRLEHSYLALGFWSIDAGHGRLRDVSGVLRAAALEDRLSRAGRLAHSLSDDARLRLAQLFSAEGGLTAAHDRPDRFLWREAARILREDGALKSGELDAESLERVQESLAPRTLFALAQGTRVAAVLELSRSGGHDDLHLHSEFIQLNGGVVLSSSGFDGSDAFRSDRRRARAGVEVETSHPQGLFAQWRLGALLLTGDGPARSLELATNASYQRMLLDRLYASARVSHFTFVTKESDAYGQPVLNLGLAGDLSYLVEDHWSIDLQVRNTQVTSRPNRVSNTFASSALTSSSNQLVIGLTWRPSGRFESPTLGIRERPMAAAR